MNIIIPALIATMISGCAMTERDKRLHIKVSTVIATGSQLVFKDWRKSLALCMSAGLGKELHDHYSYGGFDEKDLAADAIGCGLGLALGESIMYVDADKLEVGVKGEF